MGFRGGGLFMTSIGESLRRERLRRNLQLDQVSQELKISSRMLGAIEAEDFEKLPGGVFTKSFVRQYAHYLGLDEEEMSAEVERMLHPDEPAQGPKPDVQAIPLPRMEAWQSVGDERSWKSGLGTWLPALMLVVVVMLVCSAVYAFFQRPKPQVAAAPAPAVNHALPAQAPPAQPPAPASAPATQPEAEAAKPPEQPVAQPNAAAREAEPASPSSPAPANSAMPAAPGPVHVTITATEPVWVRATSDGKYVFSGTLDANQTRTVDGSETVLLRLGNAGAAAIELNGKPIGPVGPKGQVRNVQLTPGGFQIVEAPKSPAPLDPL